MTLLKKKRRYNMYGATKENIWVDGQKLDGMQSQKIYLW